MHSTPKQSAGYDQSMMSRVNTSPDYVRRMRNGFFAYVKECISSLNLLNIVMFLLFRYEGPSQGFVATITHPTKQGGIVSSKINWNKYSLDSLYSLFPSILLRHVNRMPVGWIHG